MKKLIYWAACCTLGLFALNSCFEDTGNYDYAELYEPKWTGDYVNSPYTAFCYDGGNLVMDGSKLFTWEEGMEDRANKVRYEWSFNYKVVSTDLKMDIPVKEFMEKGEITEFTGGSPKQGTFSVIDKENGVSFVTMVQVYIYPRYAPYDWFVLADDGGKVNLASIRERSTLGSNGEKVVGFTLANHEYENQNEGQQIPGKPLSMNLARDKHVGTSGSLTILTDQVSYVTNAENLHYVSDLREDFLDGVPAGFSPIARVDRNANSYTDPPCTLLANKDGKIYSRVMSFNYLGGKFLTEPYELDDKGYEITMFGNSRFGGTIPCYDSKNRRVVLASVWEQSIQGDGGIGDVTLAYRTRLVPITNTNITIPAYGFDPGTEVIYLATTSHLNSWMVSGTNVLYTVYYNKDDGKNTLVGDFLVDNRSMTASNPGDLRWHRMPFRLDKSSVILTSCNLRSEATSKTAATRDYFTVSGDNKLHYMQRSQGLYDTSFTHHIFPIDSQKFPDQEFPSKITALAYDYYYCDRLIVGCENGEVFLFDINQPANPKLLFEGKAEGKILSFKQLGMRTSSHDSY